MPKGGYRPGAGRKHGSKNKSGELLRESINAFLTRNIDTVDEWFQQIDDPYKKIETLFKVAEFALPKLARQEVTGEDGGAVKVEQITRRIVKSGTGNTDGGDI